MDEVSAVLSDFCYNLTNGFAFLEGGDDYCGLACVVDQPYTLQLDGTLIVPNIGTLDLATYH